VRILFAGHDLAAPLGGGELSARTLLERLAAFHEVDAVCPVASRTPVAIPFHLAAMFVETRFRPIVVRRVREQSPDLLILQSPAWLQPDDVPETTKIVIFMRSLVCYGAGDSNPIRWRQTAGRPFRTVRLRRSRALLERANLVVSNSRFLQHALLTRAGIASHVVTPFIDTEALRTSLSGGPRDCLTFVGLDPWKGAGLALRLADALPDRHFLFLAGARSSRRLRSQAARRANVTCLDWTSDMDRVFDRTRILLMPSLWEEPFGRLPVEAGACGIPTIASARGGLPESVGDGGVLIDPPDDLGRWIDQIRALDDPGRHASLSAAAQRHAAAHSLDTTMARFGSLLERELGLSVTLGALRKSSQAAEPLTHEVTRCDGVCSGSE